MGAKTCVVSNDAWRVTFLVTDVSVMKEWAARTWLAVQEAGASARITEIECQSVGVCVRLGGHGDASIEFEWTDATPEDVIRVKGADLLPGFTRAYICKEGIYFRAWHREWTDPLESELLAFEGEVVG